ncbi:HCNGP-like protein-domain-containing protein, partial [Syncephalastrum racemosum]
DPTRRRKALLTPRPIPGVENWGIPPESSTPIDSERAQKVAHFLSLRAKGHHLNEHLQQNRSFRNPRIYAKLVEFFDLDEHGSNMDKTDFDPHGFPKEAYIEEILAAQRRIAEEKALAQQHRTSVQFVPQQQQQPSPAQTQQPLPQQSQALQAAMATAQKVASRIARPPPDDYNKKRSRDEDDYKGRSRSSSRRRR